ncbi:MAG: DUF5305 family protein [Halobacteriaceae archaeon]
MLSEPSLRLRAFLAANGHAVAAVLLLVAAAGIGAAAIAHTAGPKTTTVTDVTSEETVAVAVNDSAVVTGETPLWNRSTRLRDRPVYLRGVTPTLTLGVRTAVPADRSVTLSQRVVLVTEATVGDELLWSGERTLRSLSTTVTDGAASLDTTLNVSAYAGGRLAAVRDAAASAATVSSRVEVVTDYDTGANAGTLTVTMPLSVSSATYAVGGDGRASRTHGETTAREVAVPTDRNVAPKAAVGVVALLGAVGAVVSRRRWDATTLARRADRAAHAEWISEGSVPPPDGDTVVEVASLPDLVDVAIDSEKRVVHDAATGEYVVIDGAVRYRYDPTGAFEWAEA